jgi:hypothetical protein
MLYNTIPSFVPMDLNIYFAYYSWIKGHDPLISRRKERYATDITQLKPVPFVEQLEQIHYHVRVPTFGLEYSFLVARGVHV